MEAFRFAVLVFGQLVVGTSLVRMCLPAAPRATQVGLGALAGVVISVFQQQLLLAIGVDRLHFAITVVMAAMLLGVGIRWRWRRLLRTPEVDRRRIARVALYVSAVMWLVTPDWVWPMSFACFLLCLGGSLSTDQARLRMVLVAVMLGVLGWCAVTVHRMMPSKWWTFDEDTLYYLGLGNGLVKFGFWENTYLAGRAYGYHWLPYAWAASVSGPFGRWSVDIFAIAIPLVLSVVMVVVIRAVMLEIAGPRFQTLSVVTASAITSPWITSRALAPVHVVSHGTTFGHLYSLGIVYLLTSQRHHSKRSHGGWLATISIMIIGLVGSKVHATLPVLFGVGCVLLWQLASKPKRVPALLDNAAIGAVTLTSMLFFYGRGDTNGDLRFSLRSAFSFLLTWGDMHDASRPSTVVYGVLVILALMSSLLLSLWLLLMGTSSKRAPWQRPLVVFVVATATVAALLATFAVQISQTSFFFLSIASVIGGVLTFAVSWPLVSLRALVTAATSLLVGLTVSYFAPQIVGVSDTRTWQFFWFSSCVLTLSIAAALSFFRCSRKLTGLPLARGFATIVTSLTLLFGVLHVRNYRESVSRVIPTWSRQNARFLYPGSEWYRWSEWTRRNTPTDAVLITTNPDFRLAALSPRQWFVFRWDWTNFFRDGQSAKRHALVRNFVLSPSVSTLEALRHAGANFLVVDKSVKNTNPVLFKQPIVFRCYESENILVLGLSADQGCQSVAEAQQD